jgi:hypothetical protein
MILDRRLPSTVTPIQDHQNRPKVAIDNWGTSVDLLADKLTRLAKSGTDVPPFFR